MKFSHYMQAVESDAPVFLKGRFLQYKQLKKIIKRSKQGSDLDSEFFKQLHKEVLNINREFSRTSKHIIQLAQQDSKKDATACCWTLGVCPLFLSRSRKGSRDVADIVQRAEWCRRYAQINRVGLRKILKKHDKLCLSDAGQQYMQEVWSGTGRLVGGTFLHSPLLDELKSLELILLRQARKKCAPLEPTASRSQEAAAPPQTQVSLEMSAHSPGGERSQRMELLVAPSVAATAALVARHHGRGGAAEGVASPAQGEARADGGAGELGGSGSDCSAAAHAEAIATNEAATQEVLRLSRVSMASSGAASCEEVDPEYQCPICLEAMYQPLGLECGHKFCADCAFTCVGKGNALGSVRAILDHVPNDAACPECRTRGVFAFAFELKETERLIKQRFPAAWAERAEEARKKEARLRELLAAQRARQHAQGFFLPVI